MWQWPTPGSRSTPPPSPWPDSTGPAVGCVCWPWPAPGPLESEPYPQGLPQVTVPLIAQVVDEVRSLALDVADRVAEQTSRDWLDDIGYARALVAPLWLVSEVWGLVVVVRDQSSPAFEPADVGFADAYAGIVSSGLVQAGHAEEMTELAFRDPADPTGQPARVRAGSGRRRRPLHP